MKKLFTLALCLIPFGLFAQAAVPAAPDAIDQVIGIVLSVASSVPAVGPYLAMALKVLGILSVSLTAVASVLMALSALLNKSGLASAAAMIDKVLPYVQFASVYNVQK